MSDEQQIDDTLRIFRENETGRLAFLSETTGTAVDVATKAEFALPVPELLLNWEPTRLRLSDQEGWEL